MLLRMERQLAVCYTRVDNVRRIRLTALLLLSIAGCASTPTPPESANFVQPHEITLDEACGNPTRFPVSQECLNATGYRYGPLLQQKSNLVMAVWRACPLDDPCSVIRHGVGGTPSRAGVGAAPACQKADALFYKMVTAMTPPDPEWDSAERDCKKAQDEDYSCRALQADETYQRQQANIGSEQDCTSKHCSKTLKGKGWANCYQDCEVAWNEPTDNDCQQAQATLADFQDRVQKAMLDAQLKAAFAPPQPIFFPPSPQPPVIIQQQAAPSQPSHTTCMPFGPGVTCNSW
jgi:hypothetical protein